MLDVLALNPPWLTYTLYDHLPSFAGLIRILPAVVIVGIILLDIRYVKYRDVT